MTATGEGNNCVVEHQRGDRHGPRLDDAFFEDTYRRAEDPWSFAADPTERARYDRIVAQLGDRTFAAVFEPACSIGVLTERLAARCQALLAIDVAPSAVERAQARCARFPHVTVAVGRLPDHIPLGPLDLVVFSEVGYYFDEPTLGRVIDRLLEPLEPGGLLVACHWTGTSADHVLSGQVVHDVLDAHEGLEAQHHEQHATYVLATYRRAAGRRSMEAP